NLGQLSEFDLISAIFQKFENSEEEVPTKTVIQHFLRKYAQREEYPDAPWLIRKEFCRKYKLSRKLDKQLQKQKEQSLKQLKKLKSKQQTNQIPLTMSELTDKKFLQLE